MKFVKGIGLFVVYPLVMLSIGFAAGIFAFNFFYPGYTQGQGLNDNTKFLRKNDYEEGVEVSTQSDTISADTKYVIAETDMNNNSIVETVSHIPSKYIGLNREQFIEAMEVYEISPPLSEVERGFVSLSVVSFSKERVVVQMNYRYLQPTDGFYIAVFDNEVVVYLDDKNTIYINTGMKLEGLPEILQRRIMDMLWVSDEEKLYDFLETYTS